MRKELIFIILVLFLVSSCQQLLPAEEDQITGKFFEGFKYFNSRGGEGELCRSENPRCDDNLICVDNTCKASLIVGGAQFYSGAKKFDNNPQFVARLDGARGQPCKDGIPQCFEGLVCIDDVCVESDLSNVHIFSDEPIQQGLWIGTIGLINCEHLEGDERAVCEARKREEEKKKIEGKPVKKILTFFQSQGKQIKNVLQSVSNMDLQTLIVVKKNHGVRTLEDMPNFQLQC